MVLWSGIAVDTTKEVSGLPLVVKQAKLTTRKDCLTVSFKTDNQTVKRFRKLSHEFSVLARVKA